jgi:hypothetical protein
MVRWRAKRCMNWSCEFARFTRRCPAGRAARTVSDFDQVSGRAGRICRSRCIPTANTPRAIPTHFSRARRGISCRAIRGRGCSRASSPARRREQFKDAIAQGRCERLLNSIDVKPGDCFLSAQRDGPRRRRRDSGRGGADAQRHDLPRLRFQPRRSLHRQDASTACRAGPGLHSFCRAGSDAAASRPYRLASRARGTAGQLRVFRDLEEERLPSRGTEMPLECRPADRLDRCWRATRRCSVDRVRT